MSFSVMVNFMGLGLLLQFVPRLTKVFGHGDDVHGHTNILLLFWYELPLLVTFFSLKPILIFEQYL